MSDHGRQQSKMMSLKDFDSTTPVHIETSEQVISCSVQNVMEWLAPGVPPHEALKFLLMCRTARLNPFLNEAYLIQMGNKWGAVVAKAGYLKRAEEHPDFDGYEAGITVQHIDNNKQKTGMPIDMQGEIVPGGHVLVGAWAKTWKKGRSRPYYRQVSYAEYAKDNNIWRSIPCTMIRKVALVGVIREAYGLSDSYDESEIEPTTRNAQGTTVHYPTPEPTAVPQITSNPRLELQYAKAKDAHLPPEQVDAINRLVAQTKMPQANLEKYLRSKHVNQVPELSPTDASFLITKLEEIASRTPFVDEFPHPNLKPEPSDAFRGGMPIDVEAAPAIREPEPKEYTIPEVARVSGKAEATKQYAMVPDDSAE